MEYQFTADWFSDYRGIWDHLVDHWKPARIVEIGSYEGRSTCYLIERCGAERPLELHCIDTWRGGLEHDAAAMQEVERRFDHNVALARKRSRQPVSLVKHKEESVRALARMVASEAPCSFDLVYVDGSHQAADVLADAVLAFQLLRVDGLMIFDDYLWQMEREGQQNPLNMPKPGIDAFVNTFQRKLSVLARWPIAQLYVAKVSA